MTTVKEIYDVLDKAAPFSVAESWDNCGILTGDPEKPVTKVLTALDISRRVAEEAVRNGAELVISHHPVIFTPLKSLREDDPAVILSKNGIVSICMHTSFDLAENGLNEYLCRTLGLQPEEGVPLDFDEGKPIGCVCDLTHDIPCEKMAALIKTRLGCRNVRFNPTAGNIRKVGVCSGSGGSFLAGAIKNGCDALITGDVKHSVFVDAENKGITVFDAGHFYTERIFCKWACEFLSDCFPEISVSQAEACQDPCQYC